MKNLELPDAVKIDIYRGNAQRLFGLGPSTQAEPSNKTKP